MSEIDDDDFEWDPEVQEMYDDLSWDTPEVDPNLKLDTDVHLLRDGALCYPTIMYDLFYDKHSNSAPVIPVPMPQPKVPYGRKSSLTKSEMKMLLNYSSSYKNKSISEIHPTHYKRYREYKVLQNKVAKEQEEFQQYLLEVSTRFITEYNYVDEEAESWVKKCLEESTSQIKHYERYYEHLKEFGISVIPFKNDTPPAPIDSLFISLGYWDRLVVLTRNTPIPKPIIKNVKSKKKSKHDAWVKTVVSKDENARRLAIAWKADVVISLGALKTLADNLPPYQNEWELPVVVKLFEGFEKQKITFVDKVFPPKRIAPREKNLKFFQEVIKHLSLVPNVWNKSTNATKKAKKKNVHSDTSEASVNITTNHNKESADNKTSENEESLLQVDGANDNKKPTRKQTRRGTKSKVTEMQDDSKDTVNDKNTRNKNPSQSKLSQFLTTSSTSNWMKKPDLSLPHANNANFQPFIGRRGRSVSTQSAESQEDKSTAEESRKKDAVNEMISPKAQFSGMSFGLLPDSALEFSQESDTNDAENNSIEKTSKDRIDQSSTTRRATRSTIKSEYLMETDHSGGALSQTIISSFGKMSKSVAETKKKATSTPTRRNKKNTKVATKQTSQEKDSDDDELILAKKRNKTRNTFLQDDSESNDEITHAAEKETPKKGKPKTKAASKTSKKETKTPKKKQSASRSTSNAISNSSDIVETTTTDVPSVNKPLKLSPDSATNISRMQNSSNDLLGEILGKSDTASSKQTPEEMSSSKAAHPEELIPDDAVDFATGSLMLIQPEDQTNASYALWKFGKKRVLIRYTIHGDVIPPKSPKVQKNVLTGVSLRAKLEYQSDYVYEQLTQSEMTHDWITFLIKRKMCIVRARLNPHKREILDVEWTLSLNEFMEKAVAMGYNTAVTSKLLTKLFEMLSDLDVGSYLCCHRVDENKVVLRKAVDDIRRKVVYDLQKEYAWPGRNVYYSTSVPWVPGDPNKPRKFHLCNDRIPMTFPPMADTKDSKKSKKKKKKSRKSTSSKEDDDDWS
ncbi:uncharacterized protein LOC120347383 [Styela clava]